MWTSVPAGRRSSPLNGSENSKEGGELSTLGLTRCSLDDVTNLLCIVWQIALEVSRFKGICAGAAAKGPDQDGVAQPQLLACNSISFSRWGRGVNDDNATSTNLIQFVAS